MTARLDTSGWTRVRDKDLSARRYEVRPRALSDRSDNGGRFFLFLLSDEAAGLAMETLIRLADPDYRQFRRARRVSEFALEMPS